MYEVEVKAKVSNLESLKHQLQNLGCELSEPITQHDYIYNQIGIDFANHKTPVLRLREQNGKIIFTLKKDRGDELDCIEKEVEVDNRQTMEEIFEIMGYSKSIEVHKRRQKGKCNGYEVCLDEVEGLGSFIEVEKMTEDDGEKVKEELVQFLESLGVQRSDRVMHGYDTLLWQKNH
jgi:adenylate cyclase, class 2